LSDDVIVRAMAHLDPDDVRAAQELPPLVHERDHAVAIDAVSTREGKLALLKAGFSRFRGLAPGFAGDCRRP